MTGGGQQQRDRHLGDGVGVARRRIEHRYAGRGGRCDVDVVGVAPGGRHRTQTELKDRTFHPVALDDNHVGGLGGDPLGQLLGAVDPQRL